MQHNYNNTPITKSLMESDGNFMFPSKWAWKTPAGIFQYSGPQRTNARLIIVGANKLMTSRSIDDKDMAWKIQYLRYYINAWLVFGVSRDEALRAARMLNSGFSYPLSLNRVTDLFPTTFKVNPSITPESVQKGLELTKVQQDIAGMTKVRKEKKIAKEKATINHTLAIQFGQEVIKYHNLGYGAKRIYHELSDNLKEYYTSYESVKSYLRRHNIHSGELVTVIREDMVVRYSRNHNVPCQSKSTPVSQQEKSCNDISNRLKELYSLYKKCVITLSRNINEIEQEIKEILDNGKEDLILIGAAGCGKSWIVNNLITPENGKDATLFLAPTGIASTKYDSGMTIHSAFCLETRVYDYDAEIDIPKFMENIARIVIDEAYMCRIDIINQIFKIINKLRKEGKHIQLILMGDPLQLLAIMNATYKIAMTSLNGTHIYDAPAWNEFLKSSKLRKINLFDNKRIKDRSDKTLEFLEICEKLRFGLNETVSYLNSGKIHHDEDWNGTFLCSKNIDVDKINLQYTMSFSNLKRFDAVTSGKWDDSLPAKKHLMLAPGMQVMTVCNSKEYKNGSLGIITKVNKKSVWVSFKLNDKETKEIKIIPVKFTTQWGITITQLPIIPAKAISIYRSQGCSFDSVTIIGDCFAPGMLYTAVTRVTSVDGLHIPVPIKESDIIVDLKAVELMMKDICNADLQRLDESMLSL